MVVNQDSRATCLPDFVVQDTTTRQIIEIQHYNNFRCGYGILTSLTVLLKNKKVLRTLHPMQKIREIIGNHHFSFMSPRSQELRHGQNRAYGIPVGIDMTSQNHTFR